MSETVLGLTTLACVLGGILMGVLLRNALPDHHLSGDTKDVVRLGTGLIGTLAALVLGLLIGNAKSSYDTQTAQVKQFTANIVLLDYLLAEYGDDARPLRELIATASAPRSIAYGVNGARAPPHRSRRPRRVKRSFWGYSGSPRKTTCNARFTREPSRPSAIWRRRAWPCSRNSPIPFRYRFGPCCCSGLRASS